MSTGEPDATEIVRRLTRRWIAPSGGRGSGGGDLGAARLTWTGNRKGTTAWRESTGRSEGVEGVAVQGPRDTAKATLLEAQTPAVKGTSPDTTPDVGATGIGRFRFSVSTLPAGGRQATSLFKGTDGPPTSRSIRPAQGEFGMAYGARALWPRSVRSSRRSRDLPGRTGKPSTGRRDTGVDRSTGTVRYARCDTPKPYWRSLMALESRVQLTLHARFGKGSMEKVLVTGTSLAAYFTGTSGSVGGRRKRAWSQAPRQRPTGAMPR